MTKETPSWLREPANDHATSHQPLPVKLFVYDCGTSNIWGFPFMSLIDDSKFNGYGSFYLECRNNGAIVENSQASTSAAEAELILYHDKRKVVKIQQIGGKNSGFKIKNLVFGDVNFGNESFISRSNMGTRNADVFYSKTEFNDFTREELNKRFWWEKKSIVSGKLTLVCSNGVIEKVLAIFRRGGIDKVERLGELIIEYEGIQYINLIIATLFTILFREKIDAHIG
ncbi:hypothetical protein HK099_007223 [Clydaea vesicula]|uniref:Uncharacterized protein n=1 Tax=Clydaea vesicula TaxID=447962 RepID=A0AAD5TWZ1_9FUNG|nr:hypothetical protein HK099_007223 [Clydaea vesicula]